MTSIEKSSAKRKALAFLAGFLAIRFGLDHYWRQVSAYYSYAFELAFSIWVASVYRSNFRWAIRYLPEIRTGFLPALAAGFGSHALLRVMNISVPFDLSSGETIFLLLVLAPLLEELVFRLTLWEPLHALMKSPGLTLGVTSVLFSTSHGLALFFVPAEFQLFIAAQCTYTLVLGLGAGYRRWKSQSPVAAILVHFGFNLGFFLFTVV